MPQEWKNWSGSLHFTPQRIEKPESEEEVQFLVKQATAQGMIVRPVGTGHSSTPLVETEGMLISSENMTGIISADYESREAVFLPGTSLSDAGIEMRNHNLEVHNLGDVSTQTIIGAIQTGTHGTGKSRKNLEAMLVGGRLVNGRGEIVVFSEQDQDLLRAVRVSLGTLGIVTQARVRLMPAYLLQSEEWSASYRNSADHIGQFIEENRHFDFYWYPRNDRVKLRTMNPPQGGTRHIPFAKKVESRKDWAHLVIPKHSNLPYRFEEMEYMLPAESGMECFNEVRKRIVERHRKEVCWRVLVRTIQADDAFLSPAFGRDTMSISLHQNASLHYREYFDDLEPIFRSYGGRPHWAKKHALRSQHLHPLYPMMEHFLEIRRNMDPEGIFLNQYLCDLLGEKKSCMTTR